MQESDLTSRRVVVLVNNEDKPRVGRAAINVNKINVNNHTEGVVYSMHM